MTGSSAAISRPRLVRVVVLGAGSNIGVMMVLGKLAAGALERQMRGFDQDFTHRARGGHSKTLDRLARISSGVAEPHTLYPLAGLVAARWVTQGQAAHAAVLGTALVGSAGIDKVVKTIVHRPRPRNVLHRQRSSGSSFPSQHLTMSVATYGTLIHLLNRQRKRGKRARLGALLWAPLLVVVALIGWSRVYVGVHHPTDVLGGIASGTLWLATCAALAGALAPDTHG